MGRRFPCLQPSNQPCVAPSVDNVQTSQMLFPLVLAFVQPITASAASSLSVVVVMSTCFSRHREEKHHKLQQFCGSRQNIEFRNRDTRQLGLALVSAPCRSTCRCGAQPAQQPVGNRYDTFPSLPAPLLSLIKPNEQMTIAHPTSPAVFHM